MTLSTWATSLRKRNAAHVVKHGIRIYVCVYIYIYIYIYMCDVYATAVGDTAKAYYSPTAKLAMGSLAQNSFGAIRCSCNPRFRRRFRRVPVQKADEVPEGSGAES